jgi:hypothetical protein
VRTTGREIEFRSRCLDDGRKSKNHFNLKFDFVSGTATISTEFSSGLKFPPISNETAA